MCDREKLTEIKKKKEKVAWKTGHSNNYSLDTSLRSLDSGSFNPIKQCKYSIQLYAAEASNLRRRDASPHFNVYILLCVDLAISILVSISKSELNSSVIQKNKLLNLPTWCHLRSRITWPLLLLTHVGFDFLVSTDIFVPQQYLVCVISIPLATITVSSEYLIGSPLALISIYLLVLLWI